MSSDEKAGSQSLSQPVTQYRFQNTETAADCLTD